MRPWALTVMPWACAHARMLPLRSRLDAVRPPRAGLSPPGLAGMLDERCELAAQRRSVLLAQIDLYSAPSTPNRTVSSAGPHQDHLGVRRLSSVPSRTPGCAGDTCTKINCTGRGYLRRRQPLPADAPA